MDEKHYSKLIKYADIVDNLRLFCLERGVPTENVFFSPNPVQMPGLPTEVVITKFRGVNILEFVVAGDD